MTFLIEFLRTIEILWEKGNRWLRFAIITSLAWPFVISIVACYDSPFVTSMVGLVTFVALIVFILKRFDPLLVPVIAHLPGGTKTLSFLNIWLGCGILTVVFFSVVSPESNPKLIPLFTLALFLVIQFLSWDNFLWVGKFGKWIAIGIIAIWVCGEIKGYLARTLPMSADVLQQKKNTFDKSMASWLKATPTPTPMPTPGFAGSALSIDNVAHWPMCKDVKAGAKDVEDIDLSGVTGPSDRTVNTNYHDCWYRVIIGNREWRVPPKFDERMCFRYAFRISERRGTTYCFRGDVDFPSGEMRGEYFEFVPLDARSVRVITY